MAKNRLTYIVVVVVMLLLVYLYDDAITYMALYAVLALPLLSLGLGLVLRRRLSISQRVADAVIIKGDATQYLLTVGNRAVLPVSSVRARFRASSAAISADFEEQFFSLSARGSAQVVFNLSAKYRGNFEIGLSDIVLYDFLGLFAFKQKFDEVLSVEVRPKVVDMDSLPLALAQGGVDGAQNLNQQEDYAIIADLRKYQPTDGYKKIHWKVSAKKNELISKNFQNFKRSSTTFIIDNSKISGLNPAIIEDMMMEALVSTLSQAVARQQLCQLIYLGMDEGFMQEHSGSFDFLYKQACDIHFNQFAPRDFEARFATFFNVQSDVENIVIIVKRVAEGILASVQNLRMFGCNVILLYCEEPKQDQMEKIEVLRDMDVFCVDFRRYYYV
ncbi:MAG: DUF58 domain-containing protein [Defluviitaleaceae bacterium]|nr:DUF58 domain-containing protein [Defluviitaleaceae bacterium]